MSRRTFGTKTSMRQTVADIQTAPARHAHTTSGYERRMTLRAAEMDPMTVVINVPMIVYLDSFIAGRATFRVVHDRYSPTVSNEALYKNRMDNQTGIFTDEQPTAATGVKLKYPENCCS